MATAITKRPDYVLASLNRATSERNNNIGAAWKMDNGSLSLKLNTGVTLRHDAQVIYTLFPNTYDPTKNPKLAQFKPPKAPIPEGRFPPIGNAVNCTAHPAKPDHPVKVEYAVRRLQDDLAKAEDAEYRAWIDSLPPLPTKD